MLGITIPVGTDSSETSSDGLLHYSKEYWGNPEVIAYGKRNSQNNLIMRVYSKESSLKNPTIDEILPYLKCGDILVYTGHTIMIYDLVYDDNGNIIDAITMESEHGHNDDHVIIKVPKLTQIGDSISIGTSNAKLIYMNTTDNTSFDEGRTEGSIHLDRLKNVSVWKKLESSNKEEYAVLRYLTQKNNDIILTYHGENYNDSDHNAEVIKLSQKDLDRLKYSKLYIEKTVNAFEDSVVAPNDKLIYTIKVKNNSNSSYTNDIHIVENISEYATYDAFKSDKDSVNMQREGQKILFNIGKLSAGEQVTVKYRVIVKDNCDENIIKSTEMVENIPTTEINNIIRNGLSETEQNKINKKYEELKNKYKGKELIEKIYKEAIGFELDLTSFKITELINDTNKNSIGKTTISLNSNNKLYGAVLNKYWSTLAIKHQYSYNGTDIYDYDTKTWRYYSDANRRADTIYEENLKTGDILIYTNYNDVLYEYDSNKDKVKTTPVTYENGEYAYIFIEGQGFVGVNIGNDGIAGTLDDRNEFNAQYYKNKGLYVYSDESKQGENTLRFMNYQTLLGKDYYAILRPSLAMAESIKLNKSSKELYVGYTFDLKTAIKPKYATIGTKTTWTSSNSNIATVDENGKVTAKKEGTCKIVVTTENGKTAECEITVVAKKLTEIEITKEPTNKTYIEGQNFNSTGMKVTAKYNDGSSKEVTEYTVVDGKNLAEGKTEVTINYTENDITKTITQAIVVLEKLEIKSDKYKIDNEERIITNLPINTTVEDFKNEIKINKEYKILDKNGNEITTKIMRTGYKLKIEENIYYEISVASDISGAGGEEYTRVLDLARIRSHLIEKNVLTGIYWYAADTNGNGKIDVTDLARIRKYSIE